ncbi:hypothetical protein W03_09860 [Nitrosomonas sp. PY1]|nr:hypothetical protein W03_09860 [Nitrosomonas sp. PY1]
MKRLKNYTDKDIDRGYYECHCGKIKLLQAGFDCELIKCLTCNEDVAEINEFFIYKTGAEILSK